MLRKDVKVAEYLSRKGKKQEFSEKGRFPHKSNLDAKSV
jgi:hypothetical protein